MSKASAFAGIAATAALFSGSAVSAQPDNSGASVSVTAHASTSRVRTAGPDDNGRYTLRIDISDLDPGSEAGWSKMQSRVGRGVAALCDASGQQPQIAGYSNSGLRRCVGESLTAAQAQMVLARDAARQGHPLASLDL